MGDEDKRIYTENEATTAADNLEGFIIVRKEVGSVMEFKELITN
jgi:hypothetical protein